MFLAVERLIAVQTVESNEEDKVEKKQLVLTCCIQNATKYPHGKKKPHTTTQTIKR